MKKGIEINNFKQTNFKGNIHAHAESNLLVFFIYLCTGLNSVVFLALFNVSIPNNNSLMLSGWKSLNASKSQTVQTQITQRFKELPDPVLLFWSLEI